VKTFVLDHKTLSKLTRNPTLAMDERSIGRSFRIRSEPPAGARVRAIGSRVTSYLGLAGQPLEDRSQVAVIPIMGPILQRAVDGWYSWIEGWDRITSQILDALAQDEVGSVLLHIDSPGGEVAGTEEAIAAIIAARDLAKKPIAAFVDEQCCSGAYWLASCVCDAGIYAPKNAEVGSVGVYAMLIDETQALAKAGIAVMIVRDPAGKDPGNPFGPISELAHKRVAESVMERANRFFAAVAAARGIDEATVRSFDGATFDAENAVRVGLIDGVCSIQGAAVLAATGPLNHSDSEGDKAMAGKQATRTKTTTRAEDGQPQDGGSQRSTAKEVAAIAKRCATACLEAANAALEGTADEAITAATAMLSVCEESVPVCRSFLGSGSAAASDVEQEEENPDDENNEGNSANASLSKRFDRLEAQLRAFLSKNSEMSEQQERQRLLSNKNVSKEYAAILESMPIDTLRLLAKHLPDKYNAQLAAAIVPSVTAPQKKPQLTEQELASCNACGLDPEVWIKHKMGLSDLETRVV